MWVHFEICHLRFYCPFHLLCLKKYYHITLEIIVMSVGCDRQLGLFWGPVLRFAILTLLRLPPSSVSISYFILAVPMNKCLDIHFYTSALLPIDIPKGTCSFRSILLLRNMIRIGRWITILQLILVEIIHYIQYTSGRLVGSRWCAEVE